MGYNGNTIASTLQSQINTINSKLYGVYTMSGTQSSNLAVGDHIEWDTESEGSLGGLATGAGQADGIITLPAGKSFDIIPTVFSTYGTSGYVYIDVYDRTNAAVLRSNYLSMSQNFNSASGLSPRHAVRVKPATEIDIDTRISLVSGITGIEYTNSSLYIKEVIGE